MVRETPMLTPSFTTTIDTAAALDEALDVSMTFPGIDDHLLAFELLGQQRLGLLHLQVGPDEHYVRLRFLGHEAIVTPARRPEDRQSEADYTLGLKVVRGVANIERLDRENRIR